MLEIFKNFPIKFFALSNLVIDLFSFNYYNWNHNNTVTILSSIIGLLVIKSKNINTTCTSQYQNLFCRKMRYYCHQFCIFVSTLHMVSYSHYSFNYVSVMKKHFDNNTYEMNLILSLFRIIHFAKAHLMIFFLCKNN